MKNIKFISIGRGVLDLERYSPGNFVSSYLDIKPLITWTQNTVVDLKDYLPKDEYDYDVFITAQHATDANCEVLFITDLTSITDNNNYLFRISGVYKGKATDNIGTIEGSGILPVGKGRWIRSYGSSYNTAPLRCALLGYRKMAVSA